VTIETLIKAVPPPVRPFEAFHGPWEPIEAALGIALPADYKDLVRLYGRGYWFEFLGIDVPRASNRHVRLESKVPAVCDSFEGLEDLPYPMWPDAGGLLPFGSTDNGDYLLWLPRSSPQAWGVVVWDRGFQAFEAFDCDMTDFLAGLATGDVAPKEFPTDLAYCDQPFRPHWPEFARPWSHMAPSGRPGDPVRLSWRLGLYGSSGVSECGVRSAEAPRP